MNLFQKKYSTFRECELVWPRRDLNTQPSDLESDALPLRHEVLYQCQAIPQPAATVFSFTFLLIHLINHTLIFTFINQLITIKDNTDYNFTSFLNWFVRKTLTRILIENYYRQWPAENLPSLHWCYVLLKPFNLCACSVLYFICFTKYVFLSKIMENRKLYDE